MQGRNAAERCLLADEFKIDKFHAFQGVDGLSIFSVEPVHG